MTARSHRRRAGARRLARSGVLATAVTTTLAMGTACAPPSSDGPKVLVLGFDGMDPKFIERHQDRLPNLARLAEQGGYSDLETVMPPQSPVAWSTVITGMTPGGHGVFDFVHRHPEDVRPFSSMAEARPPEWTLEVGQWVFPLTGGETVPLRKGQAFWEVLAEQDVHTTIMKMPTDFPPLPAADQAVSGMGTPDMLGSFGTFQFFTDDPDKFVTRTVSGGEIHRVQVIDDVIRTELLGPANGFRKDEARVPVPMRIDIDPTNETARIDIAGQSVVLAEGEWSQWVQVEFELVPYLMGATGIVRFFLEEAAPNFQLYASPINIDPAAPEVPISEPDDFAAELAEAVGPFYTQGMAEETKALSAHLISRDDFVHQAHLVYDEEIDLYHHLLGQFDRGFMFYYFSTTDQAAHMLWGDFESDLIPIYEKADEVVGRTLDTIDDDTVLMVISDHGFARFDRQVHLNRWLMDEGLLVLDDPANVSDIPGFTHVDWSKTKVYAMGLNGLYFNLKGREAKGIVTPEEIPGLTAKLQEAVSRFRDPETGDPVVERLYDTKKEAEGPEMAYAPDFLVGFYPPYRMSPETGLGAVPDNVVEDNPDEWIGDHCMSHEHVPGVLFSNRPISVDDPRLHDVPVTVLSAFGIQAPPQMVGRNVLETSK